MNDEQEAAMSNWYVDNLAAEIESQVKHLWEDGDVDLDILATAICVVADKVDSMRKAEEFKRLGLDYEVER